MATNAKSSNSMKLKPIAKIGTSTSRSVVDSSALKKKKVVEGFVGISAVDSKATSSRVSVSQKLKTKSTKIHSQTRKKKVYSLPGQKFDVPEEREPLRIFYESLFKQIPSSEMAAFWLMEHGLLSPDKAKKAYERKQRKQKQIRTGTPIKSPPRKPLSTKSESLKKSQVISKNGEVKGKKRAMSDSDEEVTLNTRQKMLRNLS